MRALVYSGALVLLAMSVWVSWVFALCAVLLLAVCGYGYTAAVCAFVCDLLWGSPSGIVHHLGMPLTVGVLLVVAARLFVVPQLRSRVPDVL